MSTWLKLNKRLFISFLIVLIIGGVLIGLTIFSNLISETTKESDLLQKHSVFLKKTSSENLDSISGQILSQPSVARKVKVIVTAYSSTPCQTDDTPYITASNTRVREGIVANNGLPFRTQIRLPELFGDKIFVIEDRMHFRKGNYHVDVWKPNYSQAVNFGVKTTYMEVLEK